MPHNEGRKHTATDYIDYIYIMYVKVCPYFVSAFLLFVFLYPVINVTPGFHWCEASEGVTKAGLINVVSRTAYKHKSNVVNWKDAFDYATPPPCSQQGVKIHKLQTPIKWRRKTGSHMPSCNPLPPIHPSIHPCHCLYQPHSITLESLTD